MDLRDDPYLKEEIASYLKAVLKKRRATHTYASLKEMSFDILSIVDEHLEKEEDADIKAMIESRQSRTGRSYRKGPYERRPSKEEKPECPVKSES